MQSSRRSSRRTSLLEQPFKSSYLGQPRRSSCSDQDRPASYLDQPRRSSSLDQPRSSSSLEKPRSSSTLEQPYSSSNHGDGDKYARLSNHSRYNRRGSSGSTCASAASLVTASTLAASTLSNVSDSSGATKTSDSRRASFSPEISSPTRTSNRRLHLQKSDSIRIRTYFGKMLFAMIGVLLCFIGVVTFLLFFRPAGNIKEVLFDPPPNGISYVCSEKNILTNFGSLACSNACAPAKCCFMPSTEQRSCLFTHHAQCEGYSPCLNLDLEDLSDIVSESDDNVVSESTSSTKQTSTNTTTAFGHAHILVPPPPPNLGSVCLARAEGMEDYEKCERLCAVATCCIAYKGDSTKSCIATNMDTCAGYSPCFVLTRNDDDFFSESEDDDFFLKSDDDDFFLEDEEEEQQESSLSQTAQNEASQSMNNNKDFETTDDGNVPGANSNGGQDIIDDNDEEDTGPVSDLTDSDTEQTEDLTQINNTSDLVTVCSLEFGDDLSTCTEKCQDYECCTLDAKHSGSCTTMHGTMCTLYQPCKIIFGLKVKPQKKQEQEESVVAAEDETQKKFSI